MSGRASPRGASRSEARARSKSARAAPRAARPVQRRQRSVAAGLPAGGRPQRVRKPPAPFQTGGRQQGNSTGKTKPNAPCEHTRCESSPSTAQRKYHTSGASYLRTPVPGEAKQVLKPTNTPIDTACIRRIQASAKHVGLQVAIGLESISKAGYCKAVRRVKESGHATPPKPKRKPGRPRLFPVNSAAFRDGRKYLEVEKPQASFREAALNLEPKSSPATLCRSFGNASADPNTRSKKGMRSTESE